MSDESTGLSEMKEKGNHRHFFVSNGEDRRCSGRKAHRKIETEFHDIVGKLGQALSCDADDLIDDVETLKKLEGNES